MSFKSSSRDARGPGKGAASRAGARQAAGVPRFLSTGKATVRARPTSDPADAAAERAARSWTGARGDAPIATGRYSFTQGSSEYARGLVRHAGAGEPLPAGVGEAARSRYGVDGAAVRVHADAPAARVAAGFGANAVTAGNDIFFGAGRYAPDTPEGERLLAHELAHVAQQGGAPQAVQCDLAQSMPVTLGVFEIGMITQAATPTSNPGMSGTITFQPDPNGPYSAEIGLIQAINITDVAGATNPASGRPVDWSKVTDVNTGVVGTEAGRNEMMTQGTPGGAPAGWYIDSLPSATPRGGQVGPNYAEHFGNPSTDFGWLRSPTDFGPAHLWDFPNFSFDVNFDFETVAKGTDNQTVYGSLFWGFEIRSGAVVGSSEYARAEDGASATFEEALERFRGYYVHEPVVLYFDTNADVPISGEEDKLADIPDYLDRYPDVQVTILGYADERGPLGPNFDLAQRRADAVENLLLLQGIPLSRIVMSFGIGETSEFSQLGTAPGATQPVTAGRLQANRRVVVSFEHSVSGHPIVMP